ncbi:MAG: uroporphyrinogen decarboxylase [Planctomycetota bacterium]
MPRNDRLLRAARGESVDRPPVWLMRQAGRYMHEYQALRARHSFLELCRDPKLACEISQQPLQAFDMDAAIIFSDILIPLEGMGIGFSLDHGGPKIHDPIRTVEQVSKVRIPNLRESCDYVYEAISMLSEALDGEVPVIGFAGAPFTLAAYSVEGGGSKNFDHVKRMMFDEPEKLHALLEKLAETVGRHLCEQAEAGAEIVQLFDTWAGELSPEDYEDFALPYQKRALEMARELGVPTILYVKGGGGFLDIVAAAGPDVLSLDWRIDLAEARRQLGPDQAVQGNLDPCVLLGTAEVVRDRTIAMMRSGGGRGHIVNLGHGILPMTPREHVALFVDTVQQFSNNE